LIGAGSYIFLVGKIEAVPGELSEDGRSLD
jgi:hypothetical protein